MELRNLKSFQITTNLQSFTKAAEYLNFTQPTVTAQIQMLEQELKQPLFYRIGKKVSLTPAGKMLKEYADQIFTIIEAAEKNISELSQSTGIITIAAAEVYCTYFFPFIISKYVKLSPDVQIKLFTCHSNDVIRGVESNEYDLGVISGEHHKNGVMNYSLDEEMIHLVVSKELFENYSFEELLHNFPLIKYNDHIKGYYSTQLDNWLAESKVKIKKVIEFGSEEAVKQAARIHLGIALVASSTVSEELQSGELVPIVSGEENKYKSKTSLISLKQNANSKELHTFIDTVRSYWLVKKCK